MENLKLPGYRVIDTVFQYRDFEAVQAPKPQVIKEIHVNASCEQLIEDLKIEDSIAFKIAGEKIMAQIRFPRKNFRIALIEGACLLPGYFKMGASK